METKEQEPKTEEKGRERDWDRSEWFRRWLELIRQNPAQGSTH